MAYCVYYNGEVRIIPRLSEDHAPLLRALVNFEQTGETHAIFSSIAASPEPDLPGYAGVLEVSEDREHLLPEEGESRHGIRLWLGLLLQYHFVPLGYTLNGEIFWEGEDRNDSGGIFIKNNQLEAVDDLIFNAGPSGAPNYHADETLKRAIQELLDSGDSTGCSPDLIVVAAIHVQRMRSLLVAV